MEDFDVTAVNQYPDTLYRIVAADDPLYAENLNSFPDLFLMGATYDTLEAAETFIMEHGIPWTTYNILEYTLPPF